MTVRIQKLLDLNLDDKKLAALLTPALLARVSDDKPQAKTGKTGRGGWVTFCDVHSDVISAD